MASLIAYHDGVGLNISYTEAMSLLVRKKNSLIWLIDDRIQRHNDAIEGR